MIKIVPNHRSCENCTACCDGHLTGEAYGHKFYPGRRCAFVSRSGCSINDFKPQNPCVTFLCGYKYMPDFPSWTRPNLSNVIFVQRVYEGQTYLHGSDTGRTPIAEIFDWARSWATKHNVNILVPRESLRKSNGVLKISIYGPDDQFRQLYAAGHGNVELVD